MDHLLTPRVPSQGRPPCTLAPLLVTLVMFAAFAGSVHAAVIPQEAGRGQGQERRVFRDRVAPHWFADNTRFWYRNDLRGSAKEFVLVDAERGTRAAAFDHGRLAAALTAASGTACTADRLPFDRIEFVASGAVRFELGGTAWDCDLATYGCKKAAAGLAPAPAEDERAADARGRRGQRGGNAAADSRPGEASANSPDGKWTASIVEHNVCVAARDGEAGRIRLTEDGKEGNTYGALSWSPDSQTLVAFRIEQNERKDVYLVESSPRGGGRARLQTRAYALPGDDFDRYELSVFDVDTRKQQRPAVDRFEAERARPRLRWLRDGRSLLWLQIDRGHQRLRVIEADAATAAVRNLVDEKTDTFVWTAHTEGGVAPITWLERSDELIHASEKSGWRHLYLVDTAAGQQKNAITSGEWVVRGIEFVDEAKRQVWFRASGIHADEDPYFVHHGRVGFDGSGLTWLTAGNGTHTVQYSPDRRYLIDTWSRVDQPPVNELRRGADGGLVCRLEEGDIEDLLANGWRPPEVFTSSGRDGKTPIWGIVCRPRDFDPEKRYPVLEDIYAGPQDSFVPKAFSARSRYQALNDLGFIVAKVDGMGTANRSKAFHDVCWHDLADAGFPDRILWHQALAQKYPHYDISRVGIYGTSAGGQSAAGALLFHGDFYKAAVANCGCHDNRMDKASWNEQWMGYPVGPHYAASSNIENAQRLRGKLLLIVGEMDTNVPPESTYRLADALIRAGKDFEYLVVPGAGHGAGGASGGYVQRRLQDFFVRHLLGKEPPDRNAAPAGGAGR